MRPRPIRRTTTAWLLLGAVLAAVAGCRDGCAPAPPACPPEGTKLTYGSFGRRFFQTYCVRCHGGADTFGGVSLTTVEAIRERQAQVYANAADDNALMPPGPDGPSLEERRDLGEWLSCGAP